MADGLDRFADALGRVLAEEGVRGVRLEAAGHFRPLATREAADAVLAAIAELTGEPAASPAPPAQPR